MCMLAMVIGENWILWGRRTTPEFPPILEKPFRKMGFCGIEGIFRTNAKVNQGVGIKAIEKRIMELEKKTGGKDIKAFVIIRNHANFALKNVGCNAQNDMDLCPEYRKAKQYPKVNPNGVVIFRPPCEDCAEMRIER